MEPDANATRYRDLALAWGAASKDPKRANRIFDEHHQLYKLMRQTPEGRDAISRLVDDPAVPVRLMAASHSLAWNEERSAQVLEDLQSDPSLHAVSAKWTLRAFRNGTLDLDW